VFEQLYAKCRGELDRAHERGRKRRFHFQHRLMSVDASLVFLLAKAFDWPQYAQMFPRLPSVATSARRSPVRRSHPNALA
jgi:hypothetical protein